MQIPATVGWDLRDLPGYDFLSEVGGSVISAVTGGALSKEDQSTFMDLAHKAASTYNKPVEEITKEDLDRYVAEYGNPAPAWQTPALIVAGGLVLYLILKRR